MLQYSFHLLSFPWTKSRIAPGPVDYFTSCVREHFCNALRDKHPSDSIPVIYQSLSGYWNCITLTTFIFLMPSPFFFCSLPSFLLLKNITLHINIYFYEFDSFSEKWSMWLGFFFFFKSQVDKESQFELMLHLPRFWPASGDRAPRSQAIALSDQVTSLGGSKEKGKLQVGGEILSTAWCLSSGRSRKLI